MNFFLFLIFFASFGMDIAPSLAQEVIAFGPAETKIEGSIPYSVIGQYKAHFNAFKGKIILDKNLQIQSVYLEIEAASIKSKFSWYDKAARSRRLLYTARYPKIIFKSDKIIQDKDGYKVKGVLEMHGIKRRLIFPFTTGIINDRENRYKIINLKGTWAVNRKDFNINWNKYLDHGGILVGDILTVRWGIKAIERF